MKKQIIENIKSGRAVIHNDISAEKINKIISFFGIKFYCHKTGFYSVNKENKEMELIYNASDVYEIIKDMKPLNQQAEVYRFEYGNEILKKYNYESKRFLTGNSDWFDKSPGGEKLYFESEVIRIMNEYANEALRKHDVVGRIEQLDCDHSKHTFFRVLHKTRKCNRCGEIYEAN